jgi:hypothetical protein
MTKLFESFPQELKEKVTKKEESKPLKSKGKKPYKNSKIGKKKPKEAKEYAFSKIKKLPLDTQRQVLSAMEHLLKVKNVSESEIGEAYKKILKCADSYGICTMGFNSKFEQYLSNK